MAEFFGEEDAVLVLSSGQPLLLGLHVSQLTLATGASKQEACSLVVTYSPAFGEVANSIFCGITFKCLSECNSFAGTKYAERLRILRIHLLFFA